MRKFIVMFLISSLLCSCGVFKRVDKKNSSSQADSTSSLDKHLTEVDTSQYASFRRWSILLPATALNGVIQNPSYSRYPFGVQYGNSVEALSRAMADLNTQFQNADRSGFGTKTKFNLHNGDSTDYIPIFFEGYDVGKKGTSSSLKESSEIELTKKTNIQEVRRVPDYSWIPYAIGAAAICVFILVIFRKWSLR